MQHPLPAVTINGVMDKQVSPLDRGFAYGDGVFETCRIVNAHIPLWNFHSERLVGSCKKLLIPVELNVVQEYLLQSLKQIAPQDLQEAVVKIIITRGVGGRGYRIAEEMTPTVCIAVFPKASYPEHYYTHGVSVRVCSQRLGCNTTLAGLKHLNRLEHILARAEWRDENIAEGLLFDSNNNLIEATVSNIFVVKNSVLHTPDLSEAGVAGVMRRFILDELAPELHITAKVQKISLDELMTADEIFLCNSVYGIWPVVKILNDCEHVFSVGKLTSALQQLLIQKLTSRE